MGSCSIAGTVFQAEGMMQKHRGKKERERIKKKLEGLGKVQCTWYIMYH